MFIIAKDNEIESNKQQIYSLILQKIQELNKDVNEENEFIFIKRKNLALMINTIIKNSLKKTNENKHLINSINLN
jgi:hypothetical protein